MCVCIWHWRVQRRKFREDIGTFRVEKYTILAWLGKLSMKRWLWNKGLKEVRGVSHTAVWGRNILSREKTRCTVPEIWVYLMLLKNSGRGSSSFLPSHWHWHLLPICFWIPLCPLQPVFWRNELVWIWPFPSLSRFFTICAFLKSFYHRDLLLVSLLSSTHCVLPE